jgi:hypothetical protein
VEKEIAMSDIGADYDAAVTLVEEAEDRLIAKLGDEEAKKHELVGYMFLPTQGEAEKQWQALLRRFSRDPSQPGNVKGSMEVTFALTKYLIALETALGERS